MLRIRSGLLGLVWFATACIVLSALYFQLPLVSYYWVQSAFALPQQRAESLWLANYKAVVQAKVVDGIEDNLSGLTYSDHTGTLFATTNAPAQVVELTTAGEVLRIVRIHGARDTEGITHINGDRFVVADERNNTLYLLEIGRGTTVLSVQDAPKLQLDIQPLHRNLGVEALSWDEQHQSLWVGQEKWPLRLLEITDLAWMEKGAPSVVASLDSSVMREWLGGEWGGRFINDLASVTVHEATGHLLLLSQESSMLVEYLSDGTPVSLMPLWRGFHGLERTISHPEGVTQTPEGHLFIVSEPNLFYRFEKVAL